VGHRVKSGLDSCDLSSLFTPTPRSQRALRRCSAKQKQKTSGPFTTAKSSFHWCLERESNPHGAWLQGILSHNTLIRLFPNDFNPLHIKHVRGPCWNTLGLVWLFSLLMVTIWLRFQQGQKFRYPLLHIVTLSEVHLLASCLEFVTAWLDPQDSRIFYVYCHSRSANVPFLKSTVHWLCEAGKQVGLYLAFLSWFHIFCI